MEQSLILKYLLIKLKPITRIDSCNRMSLTVNLLVQEGVQKENKRSLAIHPMKPDIVYNSIPMCVCPKTRADDAQKMTERLQKSFQVVISELKNKYGDMQIVSVEKGEGSFGVAISVVTQKNKEKFIIKTQKCHSCYGGTQHAELFMKEVNAINKVVKNDKYEFLLPYICAYYPTQKDVMWFDQKSGEVVTLSPSQQQDRVSLGLIVMKDMERDLIVSSTLR